MTGLEIRTQTSLQDGVFKHGKLKLKLQDSSWEIPLPAKTTPVKKITSTDDIYPEFKSINEVYQTIDSTDLRDLINGNDPAFVDSIKRKQKFSGDDELDLVLINYQDTQAMSELGAREFVKTIDDVSDVITSPLQTPLLHAVIDDDEDNPIDDPYHNYKITKENFLEEAAALNNGKPRMGTLSFLPNGKLNQLLQLYDDFDVEMLGVDFANENPTGCTDRLGDVIGRITALDIFAGRAMFAYNVNKSPYRANATILSPENFAPAGMGFDIIGGNHLGLPYEPEGEQHNFSVFDPDVAGYRRIAVNAVVSEWPVTVQSNIPPERVASFQLRKANKLISLINSEQIQRTLNDLRDRIEQGNGSNFLKSKEGIGKPIQNAFEDIKRSYSGGAAPGVADY